MAGVLAAIDRALGARVVKPALFVACAAPAAGIAWEAWAGLLGVNPTEELLHQTGKTALFILFTSLTITPLRRLLHLNRLQRVRRMLGVWAFAYAVAHFSIYILYDQGCIYWSACDAAFTWADITRRKFIFVGMLAFTILLALTVTSTNGWVRRLGRRWQALHRLVYVAAMAGVIHFTWKQKADISEPLRWACVLAALLGIRVYLAVRKRQSGRADS